MIRRLRGGDLFEARQVVEMMADVFEEEHQTLSDAYLDGLLRRDDFWMVAAFHDGIPVGGVTAHALPMTRSESAELFIYDIAVVADFQRQGIGRRLFTLLRELAAAVCLDVGFVAAANDDVHALDFCRALGGSSSSVTIFTFAGGPSTLRDKMSPR